MLDVACASLDSVPLVRQAREEMREERIAMGLCLMIHSLSRVAGSVLTLIFFPELQSCLPQKLGLVIQDETSILLAHSTG